MDIKTDIDFSDFDFTDTDTNDMDAYNDYLSSQGSSFPSFATLAYYQALSQDEQQYGAEAEYRKQFYGFINQLSQSIYNAIANGQTTISRGDKYQPYSDSPQLAASVNAFFDAIFGADGEADVYEVANSDLFAEAVTEYNYAPYYYDFAATWTLVDTPSTLVENAETANQQRLGQEKEDAAKQIFQDLGYDIAADPNENLLKDFADNPDGIAGYVDPRQLTRAELEAIAAEQNYTLQDSDYETYVGQGDENFQSSQTTTANSTFDPLAVTAAEAKAFLEAQNGYDPAVGEEDQFAGTGTESEVEAAVKKYVDPRQFTAEEAEAYLKELGFEDYDADDIATLVGQGGDDFQATQRIATQTFVNTQNELAETARQNAITEAGNIFADLDYDATQAEKETYADNQDGIADYVQGRQNNAKELFGDYNASEQEIKDYASQPDKIEGYVEDRKDNAESLLISEGYINPSDSELLSNASKTDEEIRGWADPRALTEDEVIAIFKDAGYDNPSATEVQEYIGKGSENFEANRTNSLQVYVNEHSVTEGDIVRIAESVGYVFDTDENGNPILGDFEKYIRQGAKVDADQIREDAKKELDDSSATAEELASIAEEEGYDLSVLSEEEQQTFIGNITEKDLRNDLDSRATTVQELKDIYNQRTGNTLSTAEAEDMLATAKEQNNGTLNEAQFEDWVDENIEYNLGVQLGRLGQNVLDIIFGTKAGGVSKSVEEILKEQMELLLPPSPSDPDYERKYTEWLKRRSGSIISVTHDPTEGIFAGVRFPVPIPIQGPEIKIPLFDEQGNYIGGNVAEVFVNEVGNIIDNAGKQIGQITGNVVQIFDSAGNVVRAVALEGGGLDPTTGLPIWTPEGWEEGDPNPFDTVDTNNDGVIDQQVDENGIPIDPDTGLPVVEVPDDIPEDDRVAFLSDVVAAKKEVLDTLGGQLEALGLDVDEVKNILDGVQEQLNGVATAEDLETLRGDLTQTITDELAALGIDDIQGTLDAVGEDLDSLNTSLNDLSRAVGLPAREDDPDTEEDESRPATGIYAAIEEGDAATKEYIDGLVEDIEALNVDVAAIPGLIEGIIESTSAELEALGLTQEEIINLLGSPATDDAAATGLYATIDDLSTQIETLGTDLNARIDDLVADGASRADAVDQALAELAEANNTSTEAILTRLGTTEEELTSQISDLSGRVGSPAEYDDEGNLVSEATGLYAEINTLMTEQGLSYQEALDTAISGLSSELGLTEQNLLDALGTTKDELLGEISGLSARVGSPAEYDDEGNVVTEATGLYKEIDDLVTAGMARDEAVTTALANLAEQYNTSTESILAQLGTTQEQLTGLTTDLGDLSDRVGSPAEYDDEGNLVSESTGLYAEIDDLVAEGVSRDEAINQVLSDLATAYDTNTETLLTALGTTEDAIREDIAGVAEDVAGLTEDVAGVKEDVAGLADDVDNIDTRIDDLVEAGVEQTEAINTAIAELSDKYDLTTDEILDAISDSESRLSTQIGLPARVDDPDTEEDESRPATGLYAQIGAAEATITADISDLTDLVMAYEEAGLSRDEALAAAITDLSAQLGLTEERFLTSLGETELSIQTSIDEAEANIQASIEAAEATITADISDLTDLVMAYEAAGISRDEALNLAINDVATNLNLTRTELLEYIGETETSIKDAIDASQTETNQYLDYISGVIGRPATDITQDDIDMVVDMLAEDEFLSDYSNDMRMYDVNFDGRIDNTDIDILQGYADMGVEGIGEIPATGLYGDAARRQEEITGYISDEQEITRGLIQEQAEETRRFVGAQNFLNAALSSGDFAGRKVDVTTPDPVELKYIYGFEDIFATPQQRGLFPSPYGAPQRQAAQQIAQQRGIMSGPLQLGGLQRQPGMAAGGKVDYDFTDEIMHIMSYGDS